ncbi:MAG TPA: transglutaminaseTgpA domain-containing protein [Actinomycetaceae bacterium]|nr:transglutaminaseTgpA domain-containing protein [Actinomycetaceae bacterium]
MTAARVATSIVVLALATIPLSRGYDSAWVLLATAVAVAVPFGLVGAGLRLGVRRWAVAAAGVSLAVVAAVSAVGTEPAAQGPSWVGEDVALLGPLLDAVPRLLTAPRPAPLTVETLVPAVLLAWLTALGVALVILRPRAQPGGGAQTAAVAPIAGAAVLYVAGELLTAGAGDRHGIVALTIVLVTAATWVLIRPARGANARAGSKRRQRSRPGAGLLAVGAASAVALVAAALPADQTFEPRAHVPPPQLPAAVTNPLPELGSWQLRPDLELFTVHSSHGPVPPRLTLTVLPDFDGITWRLDARLRAIGVVDEATLPPGKRRAATELSFDIDGLTGPWLPSSGVSSRVGGVGVSMDVETGTLVVAEGVAPAMRVEVAGERDAPAQEEIAAAGVPPAAEAARYLEVPRLPPELHAEAEAMVTGAGSRLEQALAIEQAVQAQRFRDPAAASGSSYGRIMELLFLPQDEGGQVGSTEQFASAFAILARSVGLPSRLVVGFDLTELPEGTTSATVRGEHATVWPEVYFAGAGWVPFAPSPGEESALPPPVVEQEERVTTPPTPDGSDDASGDEGTEEAAAEAEPSGISGGAVALAALVILGGAAAVVALACAALRWFRRQRWRASGPRGAWAHVHDVFVLAFTEPRAGDTAPALALRLPPSVRHLALDLARRAERDAFAPDTVAAAAADWQAARAIERAVRAQQPRWYRLWWPFSPRVWRRRRRTANETAGDHGEGEHNRSVVPASGRPSSAMR